MNFKKIFLLFLLFKSLFADTNVTDFDRYHDNLCKMLVNTSNSIDDYFIEGNSSHSSTTRAEFSTSFAQESHQEFEKDIRVRLRLSLPKIQENLRLVFEDETNDDALYDSTTLNDEKLEEKRYYLRLEYFKHLQDEFDLTFGGGVRIRKNNLVPYLNIRSHYSLYEDDKLKSEFFNRFRFYTDGEIEDVFEFNSQYNIDDTLYLVWRNQVNYEEENDFEIFSHDVTVVKLLKNTKQVSLGVGIINMTENFKNFQIDYYHLHGLFHHLFYKDWMYYQLAPSVLWREHNDFKTSYRFMLNVGLLFN